VGAAVGDVYGEPQLPMCIAPVAAVWVVGVALISPDDALMIRAYSRQIAIEHR